MCAGETDDLQGVDDAEKRWKEKAIENIESGVSRLSAARQVRAYRGEIVLVSGRASRRLDLKPPGGWLPTYGSL